MEVTVNVNGTERTADVEPRRLLVHLIREDFALTGTHIGRRAACTIADSAGKRTRKRFRCSDHALA